MARTVSVWPTTMRHSVLKSGFGVVSIPLKIHRTLSRICSKRPFRGKTGLGRHDRALQPTTGLATFHLHSSLSLTQLVAELGGGRQLSTLTYMDELENEIGEQAQRLRAAGTVPTRVKIGRREQAILDAVPDNAVAGTQPAFVTNAQTGRQSFLGFELIRVDLPSMLQVEG